MVSKFDCFLFRSAIKSLIYQGHTKMFYVMGAEICKAICNGI